MDEAVLAIDQGTSSTKCMVIDSSFEVLGYATANIDTMYPRPGWVEQEPSAYVNSAVEAARVALDVADLTISDITGAGIANQTETFIVWDRQTGKPIHPAITWQCRRSADRCQYLTEKGYGDHIRDLTGLELDPSFPATKLGWVLDNVPDARDAAANGRLAFGDVACWLLWNLSGGSAHITESSNASRTMLVNLRTLDWDPDLLELFRVPRALLPEIVASDGFDIRGKTEAWGDVAVRAVLGDQQSALFGQQCWEKGMVKLTLGTGAFAWGNAGHLITSAPDGILASCAWRIGDQITFAFEGFVPSAGSVVDWLGSNGFISHASECDEALRAADLLHPTVWFVPAFQGLGSPAWDADTRGTVVGLSASTSRRDLVAAALDGVAHQVADAVEAMGRGGVIRVDGGMSSNDPLMQRVADLTGRSLERPQSVEATGLGVASLAGLAAGMWSSFDDLRTLWKLDRAFAPAMGESDRRRLRSEWGRAVDAARRWTG